jgi:RNA polymerase sigma-70 factor (ECF subfamily)
MTDRAARALLSGVSSVRSRRQAATSEQAAGSVPTLEDVYRDNVPFVWRVVRRLGVADEEIEDVLHEVFLVVKRRLRELVDHPSPRTWLFVIARGVVANHRRAGQRRARRQAAPPPLPPVRDPEQLAVDAEAVTLVSRFLETLPDEQRIVFELLDIEGLGAPEVARMCDVKLNTVYSRLRLARRAFARFVATLAQGGSR